MSSKDLTSWQDASVIAMAGMWLAPLMHYLIHFHHQSIDSPLSHVFSQAVPWVQYTPRNMHTVFALLCFVVVVHWLIFPYPSGLLHWHCGNLTIAPVPAKQPWWIWINTSCEFIMNDYITTKKQSTTKPCAYFLGYTVFWISADTCHWNFQRKLSANTDFLASLKWMISEVSW